MSGLIGFLKCFAVSSKKTWSKVPCFLLGAISALIIVSKGITGKIYFVSVFQWSLHAFILHFS